MIGTMTSEQIIKLIEAEIAWCEAHRGEIPQSKDLEEGFIQGLTQAKRLIVSAEKRIKQEVEGSMRRFVGR